jgi:peptidoglycan hydrolase-like protein with peptidoglycan-binding domain
MAHSLSPTNPAIKHWGVSAETGSSDIITLACLRLSWSEFGVRISLVFVLLLFACSAVADDLTRMVQEQLAAQGAYSGPIDGKPSAGLTEAIKAYQRRHNLPPTGTMDLATAKALDDESGMVRPGVSPTPPAQPVQQNSPLPPRTPSAVPAETRPAESPSAPPTPAPPGPSATVPTPVPAATENSPPVPVPRPTDSVIAQTPSPTPTPVAPTPIAPTPSTSAPSPPGELPPQFSPERVTKFLHDYLHAGEGKYVTPQLRYFSYPVDYFGHGLVNQRFVRSDTLRYMRRWPRRRYMLTEPVKVNPVDNETATVDFTIAFSVQSGKRHANGRTNERATLREIKGELKIVAMKEQRLND